MGNPTHRLIIRGNIIEWATWHNCNYMLVLGI
jgi:hypothetical protein